MNSIHFSTGASSPPCATEPPPAISRSPSALSGDASPPRLLREKHATQDAAAPDLKRFSKSMRTHVSAVHPATQAIQGMENELAGLINAAQLHRTTTDQASKVAFAVSNAVTAAALPLSMLDLLFTVTNSMVERQELKARRGELAHADLLKLQTLDADIARLENEIKGLPVVARDTAVALFAWIRRAIITAPGHLALGGAALGATLLGISAAIFALSAQRTKRSADRGQSAALHVQSAIRNPPTGRQPLSAGSTARLDALHACGEISTNVYGLLREDPALWHRIEARTSTARFPRNEWATLRRATRFSWRDRLCDMLSLRKPTRGGTYIGRQAMRHDIVKVFAHDPSAVVQAREDIHGFRLQPVAGKTRPHLARERQYSRNLRAVLSSRQCNTPLADDPGQRTLTQKFLVRYEKFGLEEKAAVDKAMHFSGKWFPGWRFWRVREEAAALVSQEERRKIRFALTRFIADGGAPQACDTLRRTYALRIAPPMIDPAPATDDALATFVTQMQTVALHGLAEERRHAQLQFIQSGLLLIGMPVTMGVPGAGASVASAFSSFFMVYAGLRARLRQETGRLRRALNAELHKDATMQENSPASARTRSSVGTSTAPTSMASVRLLDRPLDHPPLLAHSAADALRQWAHDQRDSPVVRLLRNLGFTAPQVRLLAQKSHAEIQKWCMDYLFSDKARAPFLRRRVKSKMVRHAQQQLRALVQQQTTSGNLLASTPMLDIHDALHAKGFQLIRNLGTPGVDSLLWSIAQQLEGEAFAPNRRTAKKVYQVSAKLRQRRDLGVGPHWDVRGRPPLTSHAFLTEVMQLCATQWRVKGGIHLSVATQEGSALKEVALQMEPTLHRRRFGLRRDPHRDIVICLDQQSEISHAISGFRVFGHRTDAVARG